jgi:xanthine dehydrogenase small subunit
VEADAPSRQCVRFVLNGIRVEVPQPLPVRTLLEYLREDAGLTGTKEGCAEGDCGACTVALGAPCDGGIRWRAVNSCIRFLPTVDGCEIVTVENLADDDGTLHPVQQAMVDAHASQCGFCTPGFVMSLFALYLGANSATREQVVDTLAGNLCRCTGYRPIIDAGVAMFGYPEPARWSRTAARGKAVGERLQEVQRKVVESLDYPGFKAPRTLDELATAVAAAPESLLLAGGTDVALWVTKQLRDLPPLIYVGEVAELRAIRSDAQGVWIGAAVTLTDAWPALVALWPGLEEQAARFASPPVRNSATLCGNLANGSPIGDSLPALLALDARLQLRHGATTREIALHSFYLGYQRKALLPGELVAGVRVPPPVPGALFASYKVSKRIDQDISAISAGFHVEIGAGRVLAARIAFGGMAATAQRAAAVEAELVGSAWDNEAIERACAAVARDFTPLADHRATARYRLEAAAALLRRFHAETTGTASMRVTAAIPEIA